MIIKSVELEIVCGVTSTVPETDKPEVAFAGRSNVGKSSLINALMNRKSLARTSAQPGKTQTINFYSVTFCKERTDADTPEPDNNMYLVDLPGYGYAKVSQSEKEKWGKLIERYLKQSNNLKAVFLLVDIRHGANDNDRQMFEWIKANGYRPVIIGTKLDKIKRSQVQKQVKVLRESLGTDKDTVIIPFSAETKQGRDEIWGSILQALLPRS